MSEELHAKREKEKARELRKSRWWQNLIQNAEENLEIANERFKGGLITSFDYRTIQLNFINASQSRLNAIFNLKTTETDMIKLIGGLIR